MLTRSNAALVILGLVLVNGCSAPLEDERAEAAASSLMRLPSGDDPGAGGGTALPPLGTPTGLSATGTAADQNANLPWGSTVLRWADNSSAEGGFDIQCRPYGASETSWRSIGLAQPNFTTWTDSSLCNYGSTLLQPGANLEYRVRAVSGQQAGTFSNTTVAIPAPPSAPNAVALASNRIQVRWSDVSWNESQFVIERGENATGPWSVIGMTAAGTTSFDDTLVRDTTTYWYRIHTRFLTNDKIDRSSAPSAIVSAAPPVATIPNAPANLRSLGDLQAPATDSVTLGWLDLSSNEAGFALERTEDTTNNGFWTTIAVPANATSYTDIGLTPGRTYVYRIRSYNAWGQSAYSSTLNVYTRSDAPTNLVAVPADPNTLVASLTWTDNATNELEYRVECRVLMGSIVTSWTDAGVALPANTTSTTVQCSSPSSMTGGTFEFRVYARTATRMTDYSNVASVALP